MKDQKNDEDNIRQRKSGELKKNGGIIVLVAPLRLSFPGIRYPLWSIG